MKETCLLLTNTGGDHVIVHVVLNIFFSFHVYSAIWLLIGFGAVAEREIMSTHILYFANTCLNMTTNITEIVETFLVRSCLCRNKP
jgi:hypothetical protein